MVLEFLHCRKVFMNSTNFLRNPDYISSTISSRLIPLCECRLVPAAKTTIFRIVALKLLPVALSSL
jgi:hypothetical protein